MKYQSTKLKNTANFKGVKMFIDTFLDKGKTKMGKTKFVFSPSIIKYIIKQIKHKS